MNWWKSVSWRAAWSIASSMFSGVWFSRPMIVEPSTRMPCDCSSRTSSKVSMPVELRRSWLLQPSMPIQTQETPRPTSCSMRVGAEHVGGTEDVERPGLVVLLHQFQQPQGPLAMQQEVLVHHEERLDVHVRFELAHDVEQLVAGLVEVDRLALAAEHGRGGAEVAAQRAADRGDDRGGHVAAARRGR